MHAHILHYYIAWDISWGFQYVVCGLLLTKLMIQHEVEHTLTHKYTRTHKYTLTHKYTHRC